jgi:hypothetical protein
MTEVMEEVSEDIASEATALADMILEATAVLEAIISSMQ